MPVLADWECHFQLQNLLRGTTHRRQGQHHFKAVLQGESWLADKQQALATLQSRVFRDNFLR